MGSSQHVPELAPCPGPAPGSPSFRTHRCLWTPRFPKETLSPRPLPHVQCWGLRCQPPGGWDLPPWCFSGTLSALGESVGGNHGDYLVSGL